MVVLPVRLPEQVSALLALVPLHPPPGERLGAGLDGVGTALWALHRYSWVLMKHIPIYLSLRPAFGSGQSIGTPAWAVSISTARRCRRENPVARLSGQPQSPIPA
jgi:hypothetical protein